MTTNRPEEIPCGVRRHTLVPLGIMIAMFIAAAGGLWTSGQDMTEARLKLSVFDDSGKLLAFRLQVFTGGKQVVQVWERGTADVAIPPGRHYLLIRHGFDYDAAGFDTIFGPASRMEKRITLKKRYDLKELSWYCGESHMHGQHGAGDNPQTFSDAARLAEADGLNYIQIAQWWTPDFRWTGLDTLEEMARQATTPLVEVNWNMESPKCYMGIDDGGKSGNLHCYGHGCTLGLKERPYERSFWFSGPNFRIIREIHRQNAVVMLAHPVRFWFNNGNFVSNMASEIAFDYVAGEGYDGVDIFNDGEPVFFQHERVWWNLLNMGYKVAGTANTDGSIIDGRAGRYRTYTKINGAFSWEKIAGGIRNGACVASSGPMILFQADGKDPGFEFPSDGKKHNGTLKAWSGPLPGEYIVSVQVIRNGEIIQAWDLRNSRLREWTGSFTLSDTAFAWYAIRVTSTCTDPELLADWSQPAEIYEAAVASPVYFIPHDFRRPEPAAASVKLKITDESGRPLPASVSVLDSNKEIKKMTLASGDTSSFTIPATAQLLIKAPGFEETKRDIYKDSPVYGYCRDFNGFYTPGAFNEMRELLGNLRFNVRLKKSGSTH